MSLNRGRNFVVVLAALMLLVGSLYMPPLSAKDSVEQLKKSYEAAGSDKERMRVAIEAIDEGVIRPGCKLAVLDSIFNTSFSDDPLSPFDPFTKGAVHFSKQIDSPDPTQQAPFTGWYLGFEYDSNRTIVSYYLSNATK